MSIKLKGSSDGSVSFDAPADTSPSGSDITLTLPTSAGSANQFLKNSGIAGELEYSSMIEDSTGVGIGTTSPSTTLHVKGSGDTDAASGTGSVRIQGGASLYSGFIGFDSEKMSIGHSNSSRGLSFAAGGSEAARFDSSGRFLIGTPSDISGGISNRKLQVVGADTAGIISVARNDQSVSIGNTLGKVEFYGNEGNTYHEIADITVAADANHSATDKPTRMTFSTTADDATSSTERIRVDSDGQISLYSAGSTARTSIRNSGTTSTSSAFDVKNNATSTTTGTQVFSIRENGDIYTSGNTTVQSLSSERRLKENIEVIDPTAAWTTIKNTPYYSYNYIGQEGPRYGPIVDEVPADMVRDTDLSDDQGPIRTFDNGMLHARLYSALQQAIAKIETLEAKVAALEAA